MKIIKEFVDFDYNNFERQLPKEMRYKEASIELDRDYGEVLYWITQQFFERTALEQFAYALKKTSINNALIIVRDDSTYDFDKDKLSDDAHWIINNELQESVNIDKDTKDSNSGTLEIQEDTKIPGTNIILEKGDRISFVTKKDEALDKQAYYNFLYSIGFAEYEKKFKSLGYYMNGISKYDNVFEMRLESNDKYSPTVFISSKDGPEMQTTSYGMLTGKELDKYVLGINKGIEITNLGVSILKDNKFIGAFMNYEDWKKSI